MRNKTILMQAASILQPPSLLYSSSKLVWMSRNVAETHALAQRKLAQMDKLRTVFGFSKDQDNKEGEAFDQELQERRKRDRQMEIEQREKAKVKKAREAVKEKKRKEKERKRSLKKAEKVKKKQEKQKQKVVTLQAIWHHFIVQCMYLLSLLCFPLSLLC